MANAAVTNALTIDFEDWYQGLEIPYSKWDGFEDRIEAAGDRLLKILDETGTKATFFMLGYVAEKHPDIVKRIEAEGHEIGTHGFSHSLNYNQAPEQLKTE
jgi:peptidoglycan/xylan/chitin deacetylase (PgdA/CDA1 family)